MKQIDKQIEKEDKKRQCMPITRKKMLQKVILSSLEHNGITYYYDTDGNVYDPDDIVRGICNPKITHKIEIKDGKIELNEV